MTDLTEISENKIVLRDSLRMHEITDILRRMIVSNVEFTNNNSSVTTINFHIIPLKKNRQCKRNSHVSHLPKYYKFKEKDKFICNKNENIKKISENKECSICLNEIRVGEYVRKLPNCGHLFHKKCIDKWFKKDKKKMSCPICRHKYKIDCYFPSNSEEITSSNLN